MVTSSLSKYISILLSKLSKVGGFQFENMSMRKKDDNLEQKKKGLSHVIQTALFGLLCIATA